MSHQKFQDVKEKGGGAFGKLYKAHHPKLGRDVALKIVNASIEGAPDALAHAKAMAKVEHENIVKIFDFDNFDLLGDGESHDVIIMQWLPGETLEDCLAGERFSAPSAIAICTGVIDGLIALHDGNVAHGDLHCRNIMIVGGNRPVIIDVHPVEQAFLSQQSLTTREAKISQDIGFCKTVIIRTLRHSMVSAVTTANFDTNLVIANTLKDIKKVVEGFNDDSVTKTLVSGPPSSLFDEVVGHIESNKEISLQKLVVAQTKSICEELASERFSCQVNDIDSKFIQRRVKEYESLLQPMFTILSAGAFWGKRGQQKLWSESIESLANVYEDSKTGSRGGKVVLIDLQLYPPLLALYVAGFSAWLNERYETLYQILNETSYVNFEQAEPLAHKVLYWKTCHRDLWNKHILDGTRQYTPLSDHLVEIVIEAVKPLTSKGKSSLEESFDDFEYFCGLVEAYGKGTRIDQPDFTWGPVGRFIWRYGTRRTGEREGKGDEFLRRFSKRNWTAIDAGFFGCKDDHFEKTVSNFEEYCKSVRRERNIF